MAIPPRGGRRPASEASESITLTLPRGAIKCLEELAKMGRFGGSTKTEVATYLIVRELDDLARAAVLGRVLN